MPALRNRETGEVVLDQLEHADSWWSRFRGLMLRAPLEHGRGLLIEPCTSIHMMWMRFPIDAIWLDADYRVTRISRGVPRWVGMARGGKGTRMVIEVPVSGAPAVEVGQQLEIVT